METTKNYWGFRVSKDWNVRDKIIMPEKEGVQILFVEEHQNLLCAIGKKIIGNL